MCTFIYYTSGFWPRGRARALRAPAFLGSLPCLMGRWAPPAHRSFPARPKIKKSTINKMLPFWPELGPPGAYIFPPPDSAALYWAVLHLTELRCTLLSSAAPSWAALHPPELRCTLWAKLHPYFLNRQGGSNLHDELSNNWEFADFLGFAWHYLLEL